MLTSCLRCLRWRRCSIRFWLYKRPLVSFVLVALIVVCFQIILMVLFSEQQAQEASKPRYDRRARNKVAKVALVTKNKISSRGLGKNFRSEGGGSKFVSSHKPRRIQLF